MGQCSFFGHTDNTRKQLFVHFEAQQFFIKYNGYYFMKTIQYRDNTNFTKQHKSTSNMGRLLLTVTTAF